MVFQLFRSGSNKAMKKKTLCNTLLKNCVTSRERIKRPSTKRSNVTARTQQNSTKLATMTRTLKLKKRKKISCDICKITFDRRGLEDRGYKKHMLKHSNHYNFQCDVCAKKFKHKNNMNRHKVKVHGEVSLYTCQYCDFSTIHCSYLQVHFTRKHTDFRFSYDKCDRKFWIKADYTKHLITHEGDPCICDVCGAATTNRMSLYFHKNYKHKMKDVNVQCPVCKKKLQTQKNLDNREAARTDIHV